MQDFNRFFVNIMQALRQFGIRDIIDILIVTVIVYKLLMVTRGSRAIQVFKGIGVILVAAVVAEYLKLSSVQWLLSTLLQSGVIFVLILFQPEIRKAVEGIGRGGVFMPSALKQETCDQVVKELSSAMIRLSRRKVGALIVVEQRSSLSDIVETGTKLNANISASLLENIFEPNTPLHDGAVILSGERIAAAGCLLPLSENINLSKELGTRHRAALGVSEVTDAVTFIVSEETGVISYTKTGKIIRYLDQRSINDILTGIYAPVEEKRSSLFRRKTKHEEN